MTQNKKIETIEKASKLLLNNNKEEALEIINNQYKFEYKKTGKRSYNDKEKLKIFIRDGFIDRYSGDKLLNPGILKVFSAYFPKEFPYHRNWKMDEINNSIKSNWTLEQLRWKIYNAGDIKEWDGLTKIFIELVEKDIALLSDNYIKRWYSISKSLIK